MRRATCYTAATVTIIAILLLPGNANAQSEIEESTLERSLQLVEELKAAQVDVASEPLAKAIQNQSKIRQLVRAFEEEAIKLLADANLLLNYVLIRNDTSPRITGRVLEVGSGKEHETFGQAMEVAKDGDTLRIAKGKFSFSFRTRRDLPTDILITGEGTKETTLEVDRGSNGDLLRWRISNCSIDCKDNEFVDMRSGTVEVINCNIYGYNSGAGGSNAFFSSRAIVLVEGCTFEGNSGRSSDRGNGNAFDMRGDNLLYVRNTTFEDNDEILRANFPCVFDRCRSKGSQWGVMAYPNSTILMREGSISIRKKEAVTEALYAFDDEAVVKSIASREGNFPSERIENIVLSSGLEDSLLYWIGLLRSTNTSVREIAVKQIEQLSNLNTKLKKEATDLERDVEIGRLLNRVLSESPEWDQEQEKFMFKSIQND